VDGIRAVVDEMVGRMAADHRIQQFFVATDFRRFKGQLVIHLCQLSGGPCRYRGRSMRQVHRGRRIRPAHFEAMIEDARDALRAARVGERERHEVLSMLRGLEPEIVEQP
jgi:hemoglobin